jgi:hypothetical protein
MKNASFIGSLLLLITALLGTSSLAMPTNTIHVVDNLTAEEESLAKKIIEKNGYRLSRSPVFSESTHTIVITKNVGDEREPATIQVELLRKDQNHFMPKSIFNLKLETKDVSEVLKKIPDPKNLGSTPVALRE